MGLPRRKKRKKCDIEQAKLASTLWARLESVQNECLTWIFSTRVRPPILRAISGLGLLEDRFQELAARFTYHLESMAVDNPCRDLISTLPPSSTSLLRRCVSHPLRKRIDDLPRSGRSGDGPPSNDRILRLFASIRMDHLNSRLLPRRIPFESRIPPSFIDRILKIPSRRLRRLAIQWRCNTLGLHHICSVCC